MFLGEYEHSIDQKGRLAIPARFRESLQSGLVLARGLDRCISAYPWDEWKALAEKLAALPMTHSNVRRLTRTTFSSAFRVDLDAQGRILLPQPLRDYAAIHDAAVLVGMHRLFEIWSPGLWTAEREAMIDSAWQLAEELEL
ncbi:MAG: division/cell wall cluster transcriptional repressor MraZ [Chloroflexi bacterium]|nr:division/cell wall cluster transcriptional repressor MraZ [Chloroflexota bacterium]